MRLLTLVVPTMAGWHRLYSPVFIRRVGWGRCVISRDVVAPGEASRCTAHRDVEIVTVILAGALEHRDSLGNSAVIRPGEVQHA